MKLQNPVSFALRTLSNILHGRWKLTLFGRSLLLITLELLANAVVWIAAGLVFGRKSETRSALSLALLAWTIGLRHGLDADHISAIDNATRGLISLGQLPVTCGLFFSLGHSTIVIAVNIAIAISSNVYDKFINATNVGGIIGSAVSGSFLFLIGVVNSVILYRIILARRARKRAMTRGEDVDFEITDREKTIMLRILGPVTRFVNRPWKMYPVGVLFGLGFDTASSIALIAVSAIAKKGAGISRGDIVVLPFLFTAGMTIVDSADSILMLYSYAGFPERSFKIFEKRESDDLKPLVIEDGVTAVDEDPVKAANEMDGTAFEEQIIPLERNPGSSDEPVEYQEVHSSLRAISPDPIATEEPGSSKGMDGLNEDERKRFDLLKRNTMSGLSIVLTFISIVVAFCISLLQTMGLIGDNCNPCKDAADNPNGGGLAGSWWRFWAAANDNSGFIGAAIVGGFLLVLVVYYAGRWMSTRFEKRTHLV
ncbi:NicO-domain-containing protein [Schizopora paradoxa]|uniref:Nickel/cobalt efflux system n=1 Tax=Schizopora paradoxa TaxID=27342 RepID=A0A0H2R1L0_9AGAM|nr:NicO-domain-containing protein [Schizopora paradoxa]